MAIPLAQEEHKELRKQIKKLKKSASLGQLDEAGEQVRDAVVKSEPVHTGLLFVNLTLCFSLPHACI